MTNTEKLVEAAMYAEENGINWWEVFESPPAAMAIIKLAQREEPEEGQVACLLSIQEYDESSFELRTVYSAYRDVLKSMQQELKEILDG